MKRMLTVVALAAFFAPASIASAVAQDNYGSARARHAAHASGRATLDQDPAQWSATAPRRETYAWPDQRYYGVHGMMYD
ncbi:hypothetical protein [Methylocystis sp. SC2]|uniref:hypothetical protein n=1 Tax=Methylocystis sp. (strain SC2) TaxID=187303 RepID=UPI00027AEF4B|nr:hypothetical protein [Methylocystis sp. SC2]CCJ07631.1 Hypothetical protein BN69_2180 [Methylocystis sp. SC2]